MWKEMNMMYFKIISQHLCGGSEEKSQNASISIVGLLTKIWTGKLPKQITSITTSATLVFPLVNFSYLFHHYHNHSCCC